MPLDLFLRCETKAALRTVVLSAPFRNVIGDLTDPDDATAFVMITGSVDWVFFPLGTVPNGAGGFDAWCWLHLRVTGIAEANDLDGVDDQPDRWNRSKIRQWMEANGVFKTIRGVRAFEYTLGGGNRVQVWRGAQMEALGVKFHEFSGGNRY